ncbi:MAG: hypothetical protein ACK5L6_14010 [Anaerorhabdus sp.]|uniref:hypothetical protein n=1 Tax=Anaerorhabdus sp. TaxID=1872524 RepID=UPI003A87FF8A
MGRIDKLINKIESKPYRCDISIDELKQYLIHHGFELSTITGSHHIFRISAG